MTDRGSAKIYPHDAGAGAFMYEAVWIQSNGDPRDRDLSLDPAFDPSEVENEQKYIAFQTLVGSAAGTGWQKIRLATCQEVADYCDLALSSLPLGTFFSKFDFTAVDVLCSDGIVRISQYQVEEPYKHKPNQSRIVKRSRAEKIS